MASIKTKFHIKRRKEKPEGSKFKKVLQLVFVHNIGYKLLAFGTALLCWFLAVWLN